MAVDAKLIKDLRDRTGMGFADCKKALESSNGNLEEAEMFLRKKGLDKAAKKADRATGQGVVRVAVKGDKGVLLEVQCEQEPTTKNERFEEFVKKVSEVAFGVDGLSAEKLLAASAGDGQTVADLQKALIGVIGENVVVKKAAAISAPAGGILGQYTHFNNKAAAICALKLDGAAASAMQAIANDVCMHAVAARPVALDRAGVPADMVAKEKEVFQEEVNKKPEQMREKIMEGKLGKFYGEKCLLEQVFVKDPDGKLTVAKAVEAEAKKAGGKAEIVGYVRMELGL